MFHHFTFHRTVRISLNYILYTSTLNRNSRKKLWGNQRLWVVNTVYPNYPTFVILHFSMSKHSKNTLSTTIPPLLCRLMHFYHAACNGMQTRSYDENYSVCPSVCQTRALWQNGRKICLHFVPYDRSFILVFWEEEWLVGATPSTLNFGSTGPRWREIADYEPIIARIAPQL